MSASSSVRARVVKRRFLFEGKGRTDPKNGPETEDRFRLK